MKFSELLAAAGLEPRSVTGQAEVTSVVADSRCAEAGSCFVAVRGTTADGHRYIQAAAAGGCAAVVCERPPRLPESVACAVVDDSRGAVSRLAQAIRGWPARKLVKIAVTGTNGKSTVAHLIRTVLEAAGLSTGLLGTIDYQTGRRCVPASTTTPDPIVLAELTEEMVASGRTHLVMEASSHALDQRRMAGLDFRVGVFTNLSGDHMDYHGTPAEYLAAKRRLFTGLAPDAAAVANRDDRSAAEMVEHIAAPVTWFGLDSPADLRGRIDRIDLTGSRFRMLCGDRQVPTATALIGRHNVSNCLAAAAACSVLGIDLPRAAEALGTVERIPGRLERVRVPAPYQVFVDYAHTDDALENVLTSLRQVKADEARLIVAFGCGGDRDRTKRPRMARVAQKLADRIVVTSDNPRSEDPHAIIAQIVSGLSAAGRQKADVEADRRTAIGIAVDQADPADVVLIAGKGHETYQILGDRRIDFDDVQEAAEAIRRREGIPV